MYDQLAEAEAQGRANQRAIALTRDHCRHARIEMPYGNSEIGTLVELPLHRMEVRCQHAAPPRLQSHNAMDLAVEFYRENCTNCPYRDSTGVVPNLKTEVERLDAELDRRRQVERRRIELLEIRRAERHARRRRLVAGEEYVVRELAECIDRLDIGDRAEGSPDITAAGRELVQSARWAPALFSRTLVESLVDMAIDTGEAIVFDALSALVRAARCDARQAVDAALVVLSTTAVKEAADLLAAFPGAVRGQDLPPVLDRLIELAAGKDLIVASVPAAPLGLLAAVAVDLPQVTDHLLDLLGSEDDQVRADAAAAAEQVLQTDAAPLAVLGPALITACRDDGMFYAGQPHPSMHAARALAGGWRTDPSTCVPMIESAGAGGAVDRVGLMRVLNVLARDGLAELSVEAGDALVQFCMDRLRGDWGQRAAEMAIADLSSMADDGAERLEPHIHTLLGLLIAAAAPEPSASTPPAARNALAAYHPNAGAPLHSIARLLGQLARCGAAALEPILTLFVADSGDEQQDNMIRLALLTALTEAASAAALRDLLPVVYMGLLSREPRLRAQSINLWARCAQLGHNAMPANLADLAEVMLSDEIIAVHQTMLQRIPYLGLHADLIPRLLQLASCWVAPYANEPYDLSHVVWALWHLARQLEDSQATEDWQRYLLELVPRLSPYDRERLLTASWPEALRASVLWHTAALGALAEPELADEGGPRRSPLLAEMLENPGPLAAVDLSAFMAAGEIYLPGISWRALEFVELLQAVGRHDDARRLARWVGERAAPGAEGEQDRQLAEVLSAVATLDATVDSGDVADVGALAAEITAAEDAAAVIDAQLADARPEDRAMVAGLTGVVAARTQALRALLAPVSASPAATAHSLDQAAEQLESVSGRRHATAVQRRRVAQAWRIAATLARWDNAVRGADQDAAAALVQSVQRQTQVLEAEIAQLGFVPVPEGLTEFCRTVAQIQSITEMASAAKHLSRASVPVRMVNLHDRSARRLVSQPEKIIEDPLAVCVASFLSSPITDVFVAQPDEVYPIEMTLRLRDWPHWAERCVISPITTVGREALSLPQYEFRPGDAASDDGGIVLHGVSHLNCKVQQPIHAPTIDCPVTVRFIGDGREEVVDVAGYRRLRLRPFDPSRDQVTEHPQTDQRLLAMYDALTGPDFNTQDVRSFCTFFTACVTAAQSIMFDKVFRRGTKVREAQFHNELERRLLDNPALGGRLTRRNRVAGGFDDLLHDAIIAELKVEPKKAISVEDCAKFLGQPVQYAVGCGSQLSILVVLDHSPKEAPPGVIENYVGWLKPALHGKEDQRYPSMVGVLIINSNLPVPSTWSRSGNSVSTVPVVKSAAQQ